MASYISQQCLRSLSDSQLRCINQLHRLILNSKHFRLKSAAFLYRCFSTDSTPGQPSTSAPPIGGGSIIKPIAKSKIPKNEPHSNILIGAVRAAWEYNLAPDDLQNLPKQVRRSPFYGEPPHVMYLVTDVEAKAIEKHGSLAKAKAKAKVNKGASFTPFDERGNEPPMYSQDVPKPSGRLIDSFRAGSGRVVITAIAINAANTAFKLIGWITTGSSSMFAEAIHSMADTLNQVILAFGIHHSIKRADPDHPYGYANVRYVASLISGVGIFFLGTGLSLYHGIHCLLYPAPLEPLLWAFVILGGTVFSEGSTLLVAWNELRQKARLRNMSMWQYVWNGEEPSLNVVLLEDIAAVLGVAIAASCMGLSVYFESHIPDALGSLAIGVLLGGVATFLIHSNAQHLMGRSIPVEEKTQIIRELEKDVMIRSIQDVKATIMGQNRIRFKAEIDFDGRNITRTYLEQTDIAKMFEETRNFETPGELESFMLKHGERIIDRLGEEVDRIESDLMKRHPEVRHVDLEAL